MNAPAGPPPAAAAVASNPVPGRACRKMIAVQAAKTTARKGKTQRSMAWMKL